MADSHSPKAPETAEGAIRGYILSMLAPAAALVGVELIMHGELSTGIISIVISALLTWLGYKWPRIHSRLATRLSITNNTVVAVWAFSAVAIILGLAYSPLFTNRNNSPFPAPSSPPSGGVTDAQVAALESQLTEAQREKDQAREDLGALRSQISAKPIELDNMKEQLTALHSQLTSRQSVRMMPKTFVILTSKPDNELIRQDLEITLNWAFALSSAKGKSLADGVTELSKDLDAPPLEERGEPVITIHGRNQAGNFLMRTLSNGNCFNTHQTGDTPNELLPYYHRIWPNSTNVNEIVWIEIGPGPAVTSTKCLH
jgi:hypothetical protein